MPETWIEQATARFGQPHIAIPEAIIRPGLHRRCWVWFVGGHNYHLAIDKEGEWFRIAAGAPYRKGSFSTRDEPTDGDIRALLTFCWPGFGEADGA